MSDPQRVQDEPPQEFIVNETIVAVFQREVR
jgi:hypothetical protein